jgi:putative peptidoglycan lipid II flippase
MGMLRSMATISGFTLMSRLLGFVRDAMIAGYLGKSNASEAWVAAFRFPNMFRRIFGEGAFNAAFVPIFAGELEAKGKEEAQLFANRAFTILALVLVVGTLIAIPGMRGIMSVFASGYREIPEKFELTVGLGRITFSYLLCMALSAHLSGVLNSLRFFAMPAFAPVLLNVIFIVGLSVAVPLLGWAKNAAGVGYVLAWCVFFSGFAQLFLLFWTCRRKGMPIRFVRPQWSPRIKRLFLIMGPGIVAASVQQMNLAFSNWIGSQNDGSNTYIYYSDRIYQLPLGVFGIALGIVLLPDITRKLRGGREAAAWHTLNRAMEMALLISLPATVAMLMLPKEIIGTLFERGKFTSADTLQTALTLMGCAAGLPGYVLIKVLQPGYFARENTRRPMQIAATAVAVDICVSLLLFPHYKHVGLAIATAVSAWVSVALLGFGLRAHFHPDAQLRGRAWRIVVASIGMGAALWACKIPLAGWLSAGFVLKATALSLLVFIGLAIYAILALALKATSVAEIRRGVSKKKE